MTKRCLLVLGVLLAMSASADTWYVATNSPCDGPGTAWSNAWHTIQGGVDAAVTPGDTVLVTNGTFTSASEITITNAITVESVNGRDVTIVDGQNAHRCFSLGNSACTLGGFTIKGGNSTGSISSDRGGGIHCLDATPVVSNCTFTGNSAASFGGGMFFGTAEHCTFIGNTSGMYGGGQYWGRASHCIFSSNAATNKGGGVVQITAVNCLLIDNHTGGFGGAALGGVFVNCTMAGNSADSEGGGIRGGTYTASATNCIIFGNTAPTGNDLYGVVVAYSCSPDLSAGVDGNITADPQFIDVGAGNYRLLQTSPCRDIGANETWMATATDLDGNPRIFNGTADMGTYEYISSEHAGDSSIHYVSTDSLTPTWPHTNWVTASRTIQEAVDTAQAGDTVLVSNGTYYLTACIAINEAITVESVNGPDVTVVDGRGEQACFFCLQCSPTLSGFTICNGNSIGRGGGVRGYGISLPIITNCTLSGNTAAAVGGGSFSCTLIDCTLSGNSAGENGGGSYGCTLIDCTLSGNSAGYRGGGGGSAWGSLTNCTLSSNSAFWGGGSYYSTLSHCTLSGNSATSGGGSYYGTLSHCMLSSNSASGGGGSAVGTLMYCTLSGNSADFGGGSAGDTLTNCMLMGNSATYLGGGSYTSTLSHCTLSGNSAGWGGGSAYDTLKNCIVFGNTITNSYNNVYVGTAISSCSPDLSHGVDDNITNNPHFAGGGDYHLYVSSPCIDTGTDLGAVDDIEGIPRPLDGNNNGVASTDMGAFEYPHNLADTDGDGRNDRYEVDTGLNPSYDESSAIAYGEILGESTVTTHPAAYGFYTTNSITDLNMGYLMIQSSNGWMRLNLQLEQCTDLVDGVWSNAGHAVEWTQPASGDKAFYRVRGGE